MLHCEENISRRRFRTCFQGEQHYLPGVCRTKIKNKNYELKRSIKPVMPAISCYHRLLRTSGAGYHGWRARIRPGRSRQIRQGGCQQRICGINVRDHQFPLSILKVWSPNGKIKNTVLDSFLRKEARKGKKVRHFSMHVLRHTFATCCIEGGMKPKTLQRILGHSNIGITMNLYVHITEDEKHREIDLVADALKVV